MIEVPSWAKLKVVIDGWVSDARPFTRVCTGDDSHFMLYIARDGLVIRYKMNKELEGEHTADAGLSVFESSYLPTFL